MLFSGTVCEKGLDRWSPSKIWIIQKRASWCHRSGWGHVMSSFPFGMTTKQFSLLQIIEEPIQQWRSADILELRVHPFKLTAFELFADIHVHITPGSAVDLFDRFLIVGRVSKGKKWACLWCPRVEWMPRCCVSHPLRSRWINVTTGFPSTCCKEPLLLQMQGSSSSQFLALVRSVLPDIRVGGFGHFIPKISGGWSRAYQKIQHTNMTQVCNQSLHPNQIWKWQKSFSYFKFHVINCWNMETLHVW